MSKNIIVFAPHPDDETYGCGGTIAKKLKEGYDVFIVVMTDGRNLFKKVLNINSDPTPDEVKEMRKEEVKNAMKIIGLIEENLFFLNFEDGKLGETSEKAQEKVVELLSKISPSEVYYPYEKDFHPDHKATNRIVRNAIKELNLSVERYKYSNGRAYARIGPLIDAFFNLFNHNMVHVDISEFLLLKEEAIKEFRSELAIISPKQEEPLLKNYSKFLKNKEIFFTDACD